MKFKKFLFTISSLEWILHSLYQGCVFSKIWRELGFVHCIKYFTISRFTISRLGCIWDGFRKKDLENYPLWMIYLIISEFLVKIGPTILLVCLNIAILRQFNISIQRKILLRTPKFVKRHSSQLFGKSISNKQLFKKLKSKNIQ